MKILITGQAGMIGFHCAKQLKQNGHFVLGMDNFNDYYDVGLKRERARILRDDYDIDTIEDDLRDFNWSWHLDGVDAVLHLAAYANPRHSLQDPTQYIETNISGTQRLIDGVVQFGSEKCNVVYASSSCVMHGQPLPWNEHDRPAHQNNPYGWSKRANECQFMHSKINNTAGLRFFTVYGPYGRPDMALFKFADAIVQQYEFEVYNYGNMKRDFTYVDDIVNGVEIVLNNVHNSKLGKETVDGSNHQIYNIGYGEQVDLMHFVDCISTEFGREPMYRKMPKHPADVPETWSDTTKLQALGYKPTTPIEEGVKHFVDWYKEYYKVN
tara:strand:- start:3083 stop:4057 length:975 start_codon:yes stop_codon:yes gene_type:complete